MGTQSKELTHEDLLRIVLNATPDGGIYVRTDKGFVQIGAADPAYARLLSAAGSLYQVLNTVQVLLVGFLETADLIQEHAVSEQLERITAAIDLTQKFCRKEA